MNGQTDNRKSEWQTLGKLELLDGANTNVLIYAWLSEVLKGLNLSSEFFERFLNAAQTSAARAREKNGSIPPAKVHISILASLIDNSSGKSWGFFQIEKIEAQTGKAALPEHAIDFYLYVEGN